MSEAESKTPLVSVIIPVYNGRDVIKECLDSVFAVDYDNFEVVVVDDCSLDSSADVVRGGFSRARVLRTKRNRGFAAAVNTGIRSSAGDIIVLLNMDTVVDKGWLSPLVDALTRDASIGLVGSKILFPDRKTLQHAGGMLFENALPVHRGRGEADTGKYDRPADVDYLCGASLGFKKRTIEDLGLFDDGFRPLYFEDTDLARRVRDRGLRVVYIPGSVLVHKENISTGGLTERFYYFFHKSRMRYVLKHYSIREIRTKFLPREKAWFAAELPREFRGAVVKSYLASLVGAIPLLAGKRQVKR